MNDVIKHKIKHNTQRFITSMKWIVFFDLIGSYHRQYRLCFLRLYQNGHGIAYGTSVAALSSATWRNCHCRSVPAVKR